MIVAPSTASSRSAPSWSSLNRPGCRSRPPRTGPASSTRSAMRPWRRPTRSTRWSPSIRRTGASTGSGSSGTRLAAPAWHRSITRPGPVKRGWNVPTATDQLWVADFSNVWTPAGFVYVAFILDVQSRRILGWRVSASRAAPLVTDALRQALDVRHRSDSRWDAMGLIHHSDAGTPYTSVALTKELLQQGHRRGDRTAPLLTPRSHLVPGPPDEVTASASSAWMTGSWAETAC
jgi:transposase InsO family protein